MPYLMVMVLLCYIRSVIGSYSSPTIVSTTTTIYQCQPTLNAPAGVPLQYQSLPANQSSYQPPYQLLPSMQNNPALLPPLTEQELSGRQHGWGRTSNPLFSEGRSYSSSSWTSWLQNIGPFFQSGLPTRLGDLWSYITNHKFSLAWKGGAAGYVYLNYRLFRFITYLLDPERWIYWHRELTLAQILALSDEELLDELLAVERVRNPDRPRYEQLKAIRSELVDEIYALEAYAAWSRRITILDDVQIRCGIFCEGLFPRILGAVLPSIICKSIGCGMRWAIQAVSIKRVVYMHEGLVQASPECLRRLFHLCRIVDEYLAHSTAVGATKRISATEAIFTEQYRTSKIL